MESALGAVARLGRWFVGVAVFPICGGFQRRRQHSATTALRVLPVCEWPAPDTPIGTLRSNAASAVSNGCGLACARCCGRPGPGDCGGCGFASSWRFPEEEAAPGTTAHRALPVCEWAALSMSGGTARSNAGSAVCSRFFGACNGDYGFANLWRIPEQEEAALGNHSAQSSASV